MGFLIFSLSETNKDSEFLTVTCLFNDKLLQVMTCRRFNKNRIKVVYLLCKNVSGIKTWSMYCFIYFINNGNKINERVQCLIMILERMRNILISDFFFLRDIYEFKVLSLDIKLNRTRTTRIFVTH